MSYNQLTQTNRIQIATLFRMGMSYRQVATQIGFHHSTVSRELGRHAWSNPSGHDAKQARSQLARKRLMANQHKRKLPTNEQLVQLIESKLKLNWAPEQIAGWLKATQKRLYVCVQTIYDWLYTYRQDLLKHLHCRKGKYRRTRENAIRKAFRDKLKQSRHISERPRHIEARSYYGDWEGDTIVGTGHTGYIATFVDRKSGYLLAKKLDRATAFAFAESAKHSFADSARSELCSANLM